MKRLVIKLFPEIMVKSRTLRRNLTMILASNIRNLSRDLDCKVAVKVVWDRLDLRINNYSEDALSCFIERLHQCPGIDKIEHIERLEFNSLEDSSPEVVSRFADVIKNKRFCVRVKRKGNHPFKSWQAEQHFGYVLLTAQPETQVDLHHPEVTINLSITDDKLDVVAQIVQGVGGFPMGSQGQVISLISGGFDSGVATYLSMKRGFKTHFCFFNLGGIDHEVGVKQLADYLWRRYSFSHRVNFITVPFEPIVEEILTKVHHSLRGVILKRQMFRLASRIAEQMEVKALVTGESLAQVSSQTLTNLDLISKVSDRLLIRPLVVMDKPDIIALSREIGTTEYALSMPEYCAVISDKPNSFAKQSKVEQAEAELDDGLLQRTLDSVEIQPIDRVLESTQTLFDIEEVSVPGREDIIIDIRHPEARLQKLSALHNQVLTIPFYQLHTEAQKLDPEKRYLLYCDRGVMSQMQASRLVSEGHPNFSVFKPRKVNH